MKEESGSFNKSDVEKKHPFSNTIKGLHVKMKTVFPG